MPCATITGRHHKETEVEQNCVRTTATGLVRKSRSAAGKIHDSTHRKKCQEWRAMRRAVRCNVHSVERHNGRRFDDGGDGKETGLRSDPKKFLFTFWQDNKQTGRGSHMWLQPHTISSTKSHRLLLTIIQISDS